MRKMRCFGLRAEMAWFAGITLLAFALPVYSADNYDEPCPICHEKDSYSGNCEPITTPDYYIPPVFCDHPIDYVVYNPTWGSSGYILPNPPLSPANNLFVTNRCHNGTMKYRIEGKFDLFPFKIYVVNRFMITDPNCNWPINTERYRDSRYIEKAKTHELTHCNTFVMAINICNGRVVNAGWFLSREAANAKRTEIIAQGNQTWTTALGFVRSNKDVAGQSRTFIGGPCLIESDNGIWPY